MHAPLIAALLPHAAPCPDARSPQQPPPPVCSDNVGPRRGATCREQRLDGSWFRRGTSDVEVHGESYRDYETLMRALQQYERPREWRGVLDAGANEGTSAKIFAAAHPKARVVAIEPSEENLAMAQLNLANTSNVQLMHAALWHEEAAELKFAAKRAGQGDWAARVDASGSARVAGVTVPSLLQQHCLSRFDFVKVDVEGAEFGLFGNGNGGVLPWLQGVRYLFMEAHPRTASAFGFNSRSQLRHLQTLLSSGMHVLTFPEWAHPHTPQFHEYVYLACGGQHVPLERCLAVCSAWQALRGSANETFQCEQIADAKDESGVRGRAQRLGEAADVHERRFKARYRYYRR